jgi:hypothetical protein
MHDSAQEGEARWGAFTPCRRQDGLLGSPGAAVMDYLARQAHAVEEDRIALPFGEAAFVSQVLRACRERRALFDVRALKGISKRFVSTAISRKAASLTG